MDVLNEQQIAIYEQLIRHFESAGVEPNRAVQHTQEVMDKIKTLIDGPPDFGSWV